MQGPWNKGFFRVYFNLVSGVLEGALPFVSLSKYVSVLLEILFYFIAQGTVPASFVCISSTAILKTEKGACSLP